MANEDSKQWHLPPNLRITNPKVAREAKEYQQIWKAKAVSPFQHLSPQESLKNRAIARIPHLQEALNQVELELIGNRGRYSRRRLNQATRGLKIRLAESYAIVGRFDMAALTEPRDEYKREYGKQALNQSRRGL